MTVSGGDLAGLNGTVSLDLAAGQNITDPAGNALPSGEPAADESYLLDNTAPMLTAFARNTPASSPTNADTLIFDITFDQDVLNVSADDFTINGTTATGALAGSGSAYTLTVSGGDLADLNGTVSLDLAAGQNITDPAGNALPSGEPSADESYVLDNTAPVLTAFARNTPSSSPTNADTLVFAITFDGDVVNVSADDFTISGTTATGALVGSGSAYTLTVTGGDLAGLNGTVGLDLAAGQNITDSVGNALPASEPATDQSYLLDNTAPVLTAFARNTPATSPTNADTLIFDITFNEDVLNVSADDFTISGTTAAGVLAGLGSAYTLTVSGGDLAGLNGTVGLDLAVGQNITDTVGNALPAGEPATDETYILENAVVVGAIGGAAWDDVNGNGIQDNGEAALDGVTIYLDLNRDGVFDDGVEPMQVTADDGSYLFENLTAGEYVVAQIVPTGFVQTFPETFGTAGTFAELINDQSSAPVFVTHAPGDVGRLFVVQQGGTIQILDLQTGQLNATPFLTIDDVFTGEFEAGLLGLAFHPDYANNGKFYVNLSVDSATADAGFATHIREYTVSADPDVADAGSVREILRFDQPYRNHNGGWIGFSPIDHFLYIASGDGGSAGDPQGNGQNLGTLLGKMLRIDVDGDDFAADPNANYAIPSSNPFVGTSGAREEIWAYGLRNPWRDSFDALTGDLWMGDVGQGAREEINFQPFTSTGGSNYAWNRREGTLPYNGGASLPGDVEPVYDYPRTGDFGGRSVVGGYVYRGQIGEFAGKYIFSDTASNNIWMFDPGDERNSVQRINDVLIPDAGMIGGGFDIVSFGEDGSGNLYLVQLDGEIHKISMRLPGTHTVIVTAGDTVEPVDFGSAVDPETGSISDQVWDDLNANGVQDLGEPGISSVTVNLLDPNNNFEIVDTTTTGDDGSYSFNDLGTRDYVVEFVAPDGYRFSPQDQGADDTDSDADPATGRTDLIPLGLAATINTVDAGLYRLATIGDRVWDDVNGNGVQDSDEVGLNDITVKLLIDKVDQVDDFQDGTTQGWVSNGQNPNPEQNFPNGGPGGVGDAFLQFSSTGSGGAGSRLVIRNLSQWQGDLSGMLAIDADVKNFGTTDLMMRIAINGAGGWWGSIDAQALPAATPPGTDDWTRLTFSLDPVGFTNVLETGGLGGGGTDLAATLANVTELRILHNDVPSYIGDKIEASVGIDNITAVVAVDETTTDADGNYQFSVVPGTYQVAFEVPSDRVLSPQDQGDDTLDSDANPTTGVTAPITVTSGQNQDTFDAGMNLLAPTISVAVSPGSVAEDGIENLVYTFTRAGTTAGELTVSFNVDGTATFNSDYAQQGAATFGAAGTVSFADGVPTATITVNPTADDTVEADETVVLTLAADSHYLIDATASSASGTISNDDTSAVSVTVDPASLLEDADGVMTYTFSRDNAADETPALTVSFDTTGSATAGTDYTASATGSITFGAGESTATVTVDPTTDTNLESDETVILTITGGANGAYTIGTANTATGTITDNDTATAELSETRQGNEAGPIGIVYTVRLNKINNTGSPITFDLDDLGTGTATPGNDYETISATAEISVADGTDTGTLTVTVVDDAFDEETETVTARISNPSNTAVTINTAEATADIIDDDTAGVTITQTGTTDVAEEGTTTDTYQIALDTMPTGTVEITVTTDGQTEISADGTNFAATAVLNFNNQDPQTITVRAIDDDLDEPSPHTGTISHAITASNDDNYSPNPLTIDDVTAAITDNDGDVCAVSGVVLRDDGTLEINGTHERDRIFVYQQGKKNLRVKTKLHGEKWKTEVFRYNEVKKIEIVACGGNDQVWIHPAVKQPTSVIAGGGNDYISTGNGPSTVDGGPGNDHIATGAGKDTVIDLEGHNTIRTGSGDDTVTTGGGNDYINTGWGNDTIEAAGGNNRVFSGSGNDTVTTGDGRDWIVASDGDDTINSGGNKDVVHAGAGHDVVNAGEGDDVVYAGSGNDLVRGGNGNDWLFGQSGHDILLGEEGHDRLFGSSGRDFLIGGVGSDELRGGGHDDILIGAVAVTDESLQVIHKLWTANTPYNDRVEAIGAILSAKDDDETDKIRGNGGRDWFFANLEDQGAFDSVDKKLNEELEEL